MKNALYIVLIVLTCIGCKNRNQLEIEFENHLPKTDQVLLEEIVNSYDDLINTKYNGSTDKFLLQIEENKPVLNDFHEIHYCELVQKFDESTLEHKRINVKYDTVYVSEQGKIITIEQEEDLIEGEDRIDEEIEMFRNEQSIDEKIETVKEIGYWRFVSESSFVAAISKIFDNKIALKEYVDIKENIGYINPNILSNSIRKNKMNSKDYFIKRIIVLELFINQIRKEYRC